MDNTTTTPEYLFESSWEVCNKVGGIYTVLSTKAHTLQRSFKDKLIFIGPDVCREERCDGGELFFDVERTHSQHPFIEQSGNLFVFQLVKMKKLSMTLPTA